MAGRSAGVGIISEMQAYRLSEGRPRIGVKRDGGNKFRGGLWANDWQLLSKERVSPEVFAGGIRRIKYRLVARALRPFRSASNAAPALV